MYADDFGIVGEISNLRMPFFDSRTRDIFAHAQSFLSNGQNSLPPPNTTYHPSHGGQSLHAGQAMRRRTRFRDEPLNVEIIEAYRDSDNRFPLEIGDTKKVTNFYTMAFKRLQQINCRLVAKAFIKLIEPRKQANHPYNGGDDTKPDWWPRDVIHREPDHIKKEGKNRRLSSVNFPNH